jgi:hypothetical protein
MLAFAVAAVLMATIMQAGTRPASAAFSLPAGCWNINQNGTVGNLCIGMNAAGNVFGNLDGVAINGFWDEQDRKLTFMRQNTASDLSTQVFTGYYYQTHTAPYTPNHVLAGFFEAFSQSGGSPERSVFGWYATRP